MHIEGSDQNGASRLYNMLEIYIILVRNPRYTNVYIHFVMSFLFSIFFVQLTFNKDVSELSLFTWEVLPT